jgi:hypothetical protein
MAKAKIEELSNFAKKYNELYTDGETGVIGVNSFMEISGFEHEMKPSVQLKNDRFFEEFSIYKKFPFDDEHEEFVAEMNGVTFTTLKEIQSKKAAV